MGQTACHAGPLRCRSQLFDELAVDGIGLGIGVDVDVDIGVGVLAPVELHGVAGGGVGISARRSLGGLALCSLCFGGGGAGVGARRNIVKQDVLVVDVGGDDLVLVLRVHRLGGGVLHAAHLRLRHAGAARLYPAGVALEQDAGLVEAFTGVAHRALAAQKPRRQHNQPEHQHQNNNQARGHV